MVVLTLFYRDGDNYKCTWDVKIEKETWKEFLENNWDEPNDYFLDKKLKSDTLFEIYDFGLSMQDIPLIKDYGQSNMDHPYVSIVKYVENNG